MAPFKNKSPPEKNWLPTYDGHPVHPQSPPWAPEESVHLLGQLKFLVHVRKNSALTKKASKTINLTVFGFSFQKWQKVEINLFPPTRLHL